jgi:hypothetical protein
MGLGDKTGVLHMCDYSLEHLKSRPAKVGEKLTTSHFNSGTIGFTAPDDMNTAVCVLPGTELAFASPIRCHKFTWLWKVNTLPHTTAIFRQINKNIKFAHHDALELPDGKMVLLTHLVLDQEATVLQLPAQPVAAAEVKEQERAHYIG